MNYRSYLCRTAWLVAPTALVCLMVAAEAAAQAFEGSFDRTLTVTGPVELDIRTGSGGIRVQPGAPGTVRIVGRVRANRSWLSVGNVEQRVREIEKNPPIDQRGNTIRVGQSTDDSLLRNISISYEVTVPAATALTARTGSGSHDVGDLRGPVNASTGSGGIKVGRIDGAVVAETGSGSIEVGGAGELEARTGSGSITAAGVAGPTRVRSGSGSIRIAQTGKGDVDVSASSGGVTISGVNGAARVHCSSGSIAVTGRPAGPWSIDSSSGTVTLELPADASFDLDARASSGAIESAHPVTLTGTIETRRLQGTVRGGGPLVQIRAASGSIRIR